MQQAFLHKSHANQELLDRIEQIDAAHYPEQFRLAVRLLNHTHVVDNIFLAHLTGCTHGYTATNTEATPDTATLRRNLAETDARLAQYAADLDESAAEEILAFRFTDGDTGSMSRREILLHLLTHSAYHRGNIGMVLNECGLERPKDTLTRFLHLAEPQRRAVFRQPA